MINIINSISSDVLLWTFSTITQSFVAFVSLLSMVAIYKLQGIRRDMEIVAESMRDLIKEIRGAEALGYPVNKIIKDIEGLCNSRPDLLHLKRANLKLNEMKISAVEIKERIKIFLITTILLLIISLILLPLSPFLEFKIISLVFLTVVIIWSIISLIFGTRLVIKLI